MESTIYICIQGSQENPPHGASGGNSLPVVPFQCYLVIHQPLSSLSPEPMPRGLQTHGIIYYVVATGFLHPVEPQTLLPTGYPANYDNCIAVHPVCNANCLAVSHCPHCSLNTGYPRCELKAGTKYKEPWELQTHLFSGWHSSHNTVSILLKYCHNNKHPVFSPLVTDPTDTAVTQ